MLVVGAGTMGSGIAQVVAEAGIETVLCDADPSSLDRGLAAIANRWQKAVASGRLTAIDETVFRDHLRAGSLSDAAEADLVVEAIVEKLDAKSEIFREPGRSPSHQRSWPRTHRPFRSPLWAGLPAGRIVSWGCTSSTLSPFCRSFEVVRGLDTSEKSVTAALAFAERIGKTPVLVADAPGFVANRLAHPHD